MRLAVVLRPATLDDMLAVFRWRNAPEVRAASFQADEIAWPVHESWFRRVLERADRRLLIGELDGAPLGVVRFDIEADTAEISVYLGPGNGGRGLGTALLQAATAWAAEQLAGLRRILARVRPENVASLKAFAKAGFSRESEGVLSWSVTNNKRAD